VVVVIVVKRTEHGVDPSLMAIVVIERGLRDAVCVAVPDEKGRHEHAWPPAVVARVVLDLSLTAAPYALRSIR
jgi:hypothetical protein